MAEITVIMPVYRAEAFLREAVDSVLHQTFSDFYLILVEDGSPDGCGRICDEYAARDSRVMAIHQENRGQAAARNRALGITGSPWVCFVDSDDLIHPQTLQLLHRAAVAAEANVSMCRMLEEAALPEGFLDPRTDAFEPYTLDDQTMAALYDAGDYPAWVACGKLIRRELVEKYPFTPGRVYEDNEAVCHWLAGEKLAVISEKLYFYRTNPESTTQSGFSPKKLDFLWALNSIVRFYSSIGFYETRDRFLDRYVMETADYYRALKVRQKDPASAGKIKKDLDRLLKEQGWKLTVKQKEALLDAVHPRLIRLYWPAKGLVRRLRRILEGDRT